MRLAPFKFCALTRSRRQLRLFLPFFRTFLSALMPPVCARLSAEHQCPSVVLQGLKDDEVVFQNRADVIARQDEVIGLGG